MKPGYKQTEIGVIPEDWGVGSIKEAFLRIDAGTSVNSDEKAESRYFVLKTSAVRKGHVNIKEAKPVIASDYPRLKCPIKKGAIIISRMNTPSMVGECGFSTVDAPNTFLPDRLWQIEALSAEYDFQWLNYLLNTEKYNAAVRATATGTSNSMKNIAKERLLEMAIPKPFVQEQHLIAEAISDIDEFIASLEKLIEKKKAIKQGAMQQLLTGKTRLPGFSGKWEKKQLKEFLDYQVGFPFSASRFNAHRGLRLVRNRDLKSDDQIVFSDEACGAEYFVQNGDVLIGMDGDFCPCIWKKGKALLNQRVGKLLPKDTVLDKLFIYYAIQKPLIDLQDGTGATTVKHLSHGDVKKLTVLFPPTKQEQEAVSLFLFNIDQAIAKIEGKAKKLYDIKQGMMQQLLTGQIRLIEKGE